MRAETYKKLPHVLLAPRTVDAGVVLADQLRLGAVARITVLPVKGLVDSLERRGPADVVVLDANPKILPLTCRFCPTCDAVRKPATPRSSCDCPPGPKPRPVWRWTLAPAM